MKKHKIKKVHRGLIEPSEEEVKEVAEVATKPSTKEEITIEEIIKIRSRLLKAQVEEAWIEAQIEAWVEECLEEWIEVWIEAVLEAEQEAEAEVISNKIENSLTGIGMRDMDRDITKKRKMNFKKISLLVGLKLFKKGVRNNMSLSLLKKVMVQE